MNLATPPGTEWKQECPRFQGTRTLPRRIRGLLRAVAVGVYLQIIYAAYQAARPFTLRSPARAEALRAWAARSLARGGLRLMGARVEIRGTPPTPPFFLVSNHLGYVDIWLLTFAAGGRFIAKSEVRDWPSVGAMAAATGTIFIDRAARRDLLRVDSQIEAGLSAGNGIVLFVEGTSSRGDGLLPFRTSLLDLPARTGRPVHYATITYETPPGELPPDLFVCWWGGMPFLPHFFRMLEMRGFTARVTFGPAPVLAGDRKELAARLREAMEEQFEAVSSVRGRGEEVRGEG